MIPFIAFVVVALATWFNDRRAGQKGIRDFRAMTPAQLKALYDGGGSLQVVTPLGRILRPIIFGIAAAIIAAIIF